MPYKDKSKRKQFYKQWAKRNKEYLREYHLNWERNHPERKKKQYKKRIKKYPWMNSYYCARARCIDKNYKSFHRYGGRGIKFLLTKEEIEMLWNRDKANTMEMPSIDREDNDGNYCLENCRFIERGLNSSRRKNGFKGKNISACQ